MSNVEKVIKIKNNFNALSTSKVDKISFFEKLADSLQNEETIISVYLNEINYGDFLIITDKKILSTKTYCEITKNFNIDSIIKFHITHVSKYVINIDVFSKDNCYINSVIDISSLNGLINILSTLGIKHEETKLKSSLITRETLIFVAIIIFIPFIFIFALPILFPIAYYFYSRRKKIDLKIQQPVELNSITTEKYFEISGTFKGMPNITINEKEVDPFGLKAFTYFAELKEGKNEFRVVAKNRNDLQLETITVYKQQ